MRSWLSSILTSGFNESNYISINFFNSSRMNIIFHQWLFWQKGNIIKCLLLIDWWITLVYLLSHLFFWYDKDSTTTILFDSKIIKGKKRIIILSHNHMPGLFNRLMSLNVNLTIYVSFWRHIMYSNLIRNGRLYLIEFLDLLLVIIVIKTSDEKWVGNIHMYYDE